MVQFGCFLSEGHGILFICVRAKKSSTTHWSSAVGWSQDVYLYPSLLTIFCRFQRIVVFYTISGFVHLGAGLCVGLTGLAAGYAIGIVGDVVC